MATPSSRGSSQPRDQTYISCVSCIGRLVLYHCRYLGSPFHYNVHLLNHYLKASAEKIRLNFETGFLYAFWALISSVIWYCKCVSYTHTHTHTYYEHANFLKYLNHIPYPATYPINFDLGWTWWSTRFFLILSLQNSVIEAIGSPAKSSPAPSHRVLTIVGKILS